MKTSRILLLALVTLLSGCIVFPDIDVDQPLLKGTVSDEFGKPVVGAEVVLLPMFFTWGNKGETPPEKRITNQSGGFLFEKKTRVDWVHKYHLLARARCRARIEIRAEGFNPQRFEFVNQGKHYTQDICKGVSFEENVKIQRNN